MNVFLDSSVLLAASGSAKGASRAVFQLAPSAGWQLLTSPYAISEVVKNLVKFSADATSVWIGLRRKLGVVDDVVVVNRPVSPVVSSRSSELLRSLRSLRLT